MIEKYLNINTPKILKDNLHLIGVKYIDFNNQINTGFIVCNKNISSDLFNIFNELLLLKFPIESIIPISEFNFDDLQSVENNNSSCFNYRTVIGSNKLSDHSTGNAIDINPFQNPWIHTNAHKIEGRIYNTNQKGTINNSVVSIFKKYEFLWGGDWINPDYQHFYKPDNVLKELILSQTTS